MSTSAIDSCVDCPNFRPDVEPGGRSIAACAELNKAIFVGTLSPMDHLRKLAKACPSAGIPSSSEEPLNYTYIEDLVLTPPSRTVKPAVLSGCGSCVNYVAPSSVAGEVVLDGVAMCRAKGSFIDPYTAADGCDYAREGYPSTTVVKLANLIFDTSEITSSPEVAAKIAATARADRASQPVFNPETYATDTPVTEEYKGIIRAWRLVEAGDGDKRIGYYLPIFDPEYFTSGERELIPKFGDSDSPELYHDGSGIVEAFTIESWKEGNPLCLVGEPGTGKTEGGRQIAYILQCPFTHLQVTEDTLPDEFLGKTAYTPEIGTHFVWGRFPRAAVRPGVLLSDEINTGADSILQSYRSFNASGHIFLDGEEDDSKHIAKQHDYCFNLLAMNPSWDARNLGTRELADADVSRMSYLYVEEPDEATIMRIIVAKLDDLDLTVSDEELAGMMKVRKDIKEMSASGALPYSWSIRQDVKVARKLAYYSPMHAYQRALLDYCSPDVGELVMKAVQSVFGYDPS